MSDADSGFASDVHLGGVTPESCDVVEGEADNGVTLTGSVMVLDSLEFTTVPVTQWLSLTELDGVAELITSAGNQTWAITTTDVGGAFSLPGILPGLQVLRVNQTEGNSLTMPTLSTVALQADNSVDLPVVSQALVDRAFAEAGVARSEGDGHVLIKFLGARDGTRFDLAFSSGVPVYEVDGEFSKAATSFDSSGVAAILNVPAGEYPCGSEFQFRLEFEGETLDRDPIIVAADSVTMVIADMGW